VQFTRLVKGERHIDGFCGSGGHDDLALIHGSAGINPAVAQYGGRRLLSGFQSAPRRRKRGGGRLRSSAASR
jgi:hypothetical protein